MNKENNNEIVEKYREAIHATYSKAVSSMQRLEYKEALVLLNILINMELQFYPISNSKNYDNVKNQTFYLVYKCYFELHDFMNASKILDEAQELNEREHGDNNIYSLIIDEGSNLFYKGYEFYEECNYKKAVELYDYAINITGFGDYIFHKGMALYKLHMFDDAIKCLKEAAFTVNSASALGYYKNDNFKPDIIYEDYFCFNRIQIEVYEDYKKNIYSLSKIAQTFYLKGVYQFLISDFYKAIEYFTKAIETSPITSFFYLYRAYALEGYDNFYDGNDKKSSAREDYIRAIKLDPKNADKFVDKTEHDKRIAIARAEERSEIIAKISHSIKNLVATIIDPLESIKNDSSHSSQTINNALRGATIIREIVNSMNSSLKGSKEDFIYDAKHNEFDDAMSFEHIIIESLKTSINNMFDGKYFKNFVDKYFPSKAIYMEAKQEWTLVSKSGNIIGYHNFIERFFFNFKIDVEDIKELRIGNEKGSAIKFLILFQEIIFNAVKYTSFIDKDDREVSLSIKCNNNKIIFNICNTYEPEIKTKSSGLGKEIIHNMSDLLKAELKIQEEKGIHNLNLEYENIWRK